jgi:diacylglycerol kinase (ATP)
MEKALKEKKKVFAIMNPVGGNCVPDVVQKSLDDHIKTKFGDYTLYTTTGKEEMKKVVEGALKAKHNLFIAIGGDGTVSAVGESLVHKNIPMGIIPVGTANALAKELGIPTNVDDAAKLIGGTFETKKIDAMKVGSRYYFLDIGIGAKTLAIKDTKKKDKQKFGVLAYIWNGMKWFKKFQPQEFHITTDTVDVRLQAMEVVIANGGTIGNAAFQYGTHIKIDDGLINICVIRTQSVSDFIPVFYKFFMEKKIQNVGAKVEEKLPLPDKGFQKESANTDDILSPVNKGVSNAQVKYINVLEKATIESFGNLPIQADGEIIAEKKITIEVVPHALTLIVPVAS